MTITGLVAADPNRDSLPGQMAVARGSHLLEYSLQVPHPTRIVLCGPEVGIIQRGIPILLARG